LHAALRELIDGKLAQAHAPQWAMPNAEVRQAFRNLWTPAMTGPAAALARVEDVAIPAERGPLAARCYAATRAPQPAMLYFHGGGFVKGGLDESDVFCRNLAAATQHVVVSVDYRLAPEHRFPAAHDDALAATRWVATNAQALGARPGPLVVCGESAGGNLAAATCLQLRSEPTIAIRGQVLLQPVVDFTMSFPSIAMPASECLVPRDDLAWYYRTYTGGAIDARDPRISPLHAASLAGAPPALVIAAEYDTLRDEARAYTDRLAAAGVKATYECVPGMIHGFLQMGGLVHEAQASLATIAKALVAEGPPA
jgi:acetyl esterase